MEIVGVWVDCDDYDDDDDAVLGESWDRVRERFGGRWRLERVGLGDVFEVDGGLLGDRERLELMRGLKVTGEEVVGGGSGLRGAEILACVLRGLPEASSRTDLLVSLRMRLVTAFARRNGCWIVAWGDSMSRLAEKTLAETAKGRGYSLPWQTGDGETPFGGGGGGIRFMYPFQDLYRKEIELWADVASDPLLVDILGRSRTVKNSSLVSSKHLTIDDLMRRYFQGVEESYPSLVANVVRTSNKLEAPSNSNLGLDPWITCVVCGLAYDSQAGDLDIWEGNQKDGMIDSRNRNVEGLDRRKLCYACDRTMKRAKIVGPT